MEFIVIGEPQVLKRHRFGRGRMYNPSAKEQKRFADQCDLPDQPLEEDLSIEMEFRFVRPKSHSKMKRKPAHPMRKDLDNLIKFVLDALNKKLFADDRQVVSITARKVYADEAATVVRVEEI